MSPTEEHSTAGTVESLGVEEKLEVELNDLLAKIEETEPQTTKAVKILFGQLLSDLKARSDRRVGTERAFSVLSKQVTGVSVESRWLAFFAIFLGYFGWVISSFLVLLEANRVEMFVTFSVIGLVFIALLAWATRAYLRRIIERLTDFRKPRHETPKIH